MAVPNKKQIEASKAKYAKFAKQLDSNGYPKEVTENVVKQFVRQAVRKHWMFSPVKLAFLYSRREQDLDPNTRTLWKYKCDKCGNYFKEQDVEVDHIEGEKSFTSLDSILDWAKSILEVSAHADLQLLCKEDHKIKSQAELMGVDWRTEEGWLEATIEKETIAICKGSGSPEKAWLNVRGISPESNKDKRRTQVRDELFREHAEEN
jgi:hypothetical protein